MQCSGRMSVNELSSGLNDALERHPGAAGRGAQDPVVEEARGTIRVLPEGDEQQTAADQVEFLRVDVGRRQTRQQSLAGGLGSVHG